MYHPNADLGHKCTNATQEFKIWDQRIPNEPLLDRVFLIDRPPVIHRVPPLTTGQCIAPPTQLLLLTRKIEQQSADYWRNNLQGNGVQGLPVASSASMPLKRHVSGYPDRPWLHGVNYNINADSELRGLNYFNPEDCVDEATLRRLQEKNNQAYIRLLQEYHVPSNNYPNETQKWFGNTTKMINVEPINFDYTAHIMRCTQK